MYENKELLHQVGKNDYRYQEVPGSISVRVLGSFSNDLSLL